jgi:hypothetical protein
VNSFYRIRNNDSWIPFSNSSLASGEQFAHAVEIGVGEHPADAGSQVFFEELDSPDMVVAGVKIDAVGMVALGAAALAPRMRRSKREETDAADLAAVPHPRRRSTLTAHNRSLGETRAKAETPSCGWSKSPKGLCPSKAAWLENLYATLC